MYHIVSRFDVRPDHRGDFIRSALEDGRNSIVDELGTLRFELIEEERTFGGLTRFWLNEAYVDLNAFKHHEAGPHFKRFFKLIEDYTEWPEEAVLRGTTFTDGEAERQGILRIRP